jgi:pimeloyl-ACP methyl ester carboxylesterase
LSTRPSTGKRERELFVDGLRVFVRERGEGTPLLMVNGLGANAEMWGPAEQKLSKVARTIVFDAPGTGRSGTSPVPMPMSSLAKLVWRVIDELGHDSVDVLGFSLGGVLAQQVVRERQERVRRLALCATACGWGSMPPTLSALALILMPFRYYSRTLYERTNYLLGEEDGQGDRLRAQAEARLRYPPSLLGYAHQLWAGAWWSSLSWLPTLDVPTLVVTGDADRLVPPANSVQLARLLPESRLHVFPDEGHLLLFDPRSGAHEPLVDFFSCPSHEASQAWRTGVDVSSDETVHAALEKSVGAQPWRAFSDLFRRLVSPERAA